MNNTGTTFGLSKSDTNIILFIVGVLIFLYLIKRLLQWRSGLSNRNAVSKKVSGEEAIYRPKYWFQCKHCKVTVRRESIPNSEGCFKGPDHYWTELAEVGNDKYLCRSCSTLIETKNIPVTLDCPDAPEHTWIKLGITSPARQR